MEGNCLSRTKKLLNKNSNWVIYSNKKSRFIQQNMKLLWSTFIINKKHLFEA